MISSALKGLALAVALSGLLIPRNAWAEPHDYCVEWDPRCDPEAAQEKRYMAHVIAVGVNDYPDGVDLGGAVRDARTFAARIERDPNRLLDSVSVTLLLDGEATLESIDRAFAAVIRRASPDDLVIFFFAGRSVYSADSLGARTVFLCTVDADCSNTSPRGGITGTRLRLWLESTRALRQLIVLDACSDPAYASELISAVSGADLTEAALSARQRVVLSSLAAAYEDRDSAGAYGLLTRAVTSTDFALTADPFGPPGGRRHLFERDLRFREQEVQVAYGIDWKRSASWESTEESTGGRLTAGGERLVLGIFFERDFLDLLERSHARAVMGPMRGFDLAAAPTPGSEASMGVARALVIGTSSYEGTRSWSNLANPIIDARAIARELEGTYGFATTLLENPTKREINSALRHLQTLAYDPNDQVFIFLAGHGYYDERMTMGFLVPRDARALTEDEDLESYISFAQIEGYVNNIPARHILVALDACFGGTFSDPIGTGGSRSETGYRSASRSELIARKLQYRSRLYIASGGKEYVPDGRPGRHSPFASRFLEALRERGTDGVVTMASLQAALERISPPTPQPRAGNFGDHEPAGDFIFVAR